MLADIFFSTRPIIEIQHLLGPEWERLVHGLSLLGDSRLVLIFGIALFWYTTRQRPYQVLAASLLGAAISSVLKILFNQPRPADPEMLILSGAVSPSFPSGHVVLATCFWGTLVWYGWIPRWVGAGIVAIVMFTRVYLGAHFVGDVLFGAIIGLIWLAIFHRWVGPWLGQIPRQRLAQVVALILVASFAVLPISSAFPFGWEITGGLVGAGAGLILQQYRVRFEPRTVGAYWQIAKVPIGFVGIAGVLILDLFLAPEILALELAMYFLAAFWGLLLAPAIFQRLGLGEDHDAQPATVQAR